MTPKILHLLRAAVASCAAFFLLVAFAVVGDSMLGSDADDESEFLDTRQVRSEYVEMMRANDEMLDAWGGATPPGALRLAIQQKQQMVAANLAASVPNADGEWREFGIGPLITDDPRYGSVNGLGIGFNAGRVDSFAYDPVAKRLFAAVGTGGVWATTDLGQHWVDVGARLPTLIIGAVAWTSAGGGTLLAGSGEASNGGNAYVGMGAFWTNDLGATWNEATGVPDGAMTYQVEVDPANPDIVYMGTSKGLYRSTDAGRTYTYVVLPTGCTNLGDAKCQFANWVTDVVVKEPGGSTNVTCVATGCPVLAAVGYRGGQRLYLDGTMHSPNNGLYRSDTGAPGTFAKLDVSALGTTPLGFALQDHIGRVELGNATGPAQNHNYVYAMVQDAVRLNGQQGLVDVPGGGFQNPAGNNSNFNGIYVSADFGSSWIRMADENELLNPSTGSSLATIQAAGYAPGIQAWYNLYVTVDPTRADPTGVPTRIVFGLEEVWTNRAPNVPLNGSGQQGNEDFKVIGTYFSGTTCQFVGGVPACPTTDPPTAATTTHPDQQDAIFVPDAAGGAHLFVGNDGGVYTQHAVATSGEYDNSRWGKGVNQGFYTLLPYSVAVSKDCTVWFGLQDNGSGRIEPDTRKVLETFGGDGTFASTDPANSSVAYSATPNGAMRRTTNGGQTWTAMAAPGAAATKLFVTPWVLDPTDANHMLTGGGTFTESVNVSTGAAWTQVFNPGAGPAGEQRYVTAVDLHGAAAYGAFCGLCNVFTTRANTNQAFHSGIATNVGGALPPKKGAADGWHLATAAGLPNRYITSFEIDPVDPATVYVSLSGYENRQWAPPGQYLDPNANIGVGHVYKSTNAGESFVDVSGNLPDVPVFWVTLRAGQLIAGTQIGPFISSDTDGTLWAPMGTGMPNVPVVQFNTWLGDLTHMFAATFGRGVWRYQFPGERDVCPIPAPEIIAAAPLQGAPTGVDSVAADPACSPDTDGGFSLNFTYTAPPDGTDPSRFRIEEATRVDEAFFDDADEALSGGSNATWEGSGDPDGWSSQVNPNTGSLAYYVPDTLDQNQTLTMKNAVVIPPGGALLSLETTQATETGFDFASVEISVDDGASFASLGVFSGVFVGQRQFDLSAYAGNPVKLRLRMTSDSNTGLTGWHVEDLRIVTDDFTLLADVAGTATSHALSDRPNGARHYRVRGLFDIPAGTVAGPYSNNKCVNVDIPNVLPVAQAGADFTVDEGQTALLSAAGSGDPDGGALDYDWQQTAGPAVILNGDDTATPNFDAPSVTADTPLTFALTVTDNRGATATDSVTVTVRDLNLPPVADAGADFAVDSGASVLLSGAGSSDPDNDTLSYSWSQTGGPGVTLANANTAAPTFTAPAVTADTPLTFVLTVSDASSVEATDDVVVTVRVPQPDTIGDNSVGGALPPLTLLLLGLLGLRRRRIA